MGWGESKAGERRNGAGNDEGGSGQIGGHSFIPCSLILQFMVKSQQSWIVSNRSSGGKHLAKMLLITAYIEHRV